MKATVICTLLGLLSFTTEVAFTQSVEKPNILWISTEDISPAWGCYGDREATTPNIDAIAKEGYVFTKASSNAPICAPARSTLISGMYATSLGTQNLRSEITIPNGFKILPQLMRTQGYYTSNNAKTDYNFDPQDKWDDLGTKAHWRNKKDNSPFFSVFNFMITHEGPTNHYKPEDTQSLTVKHQPSEMKIPPYFPDTEEFRRIMAHQYDLISVFDQGVGRIVNELKADGLYENTIIFIFSDHGYGLPRYKRWLNNTGLQVPFVLHVPEKYKYLVSNLTIGKVDKNVSFVDFAPTVLALVGAATPQNMEGKNFLGKNAAANPYSYGYRDRADDAYDMSRSVFDGRYLYVRNFMPHLPYIQEVEIFNETKDAYRELKRVKKASGLSAESMKMFLPKPTEELYDLQKDPYELNNIINRPEEKKNVLRLQEKLKQHILSTHDTGLMNEGQMMKIAKGTSVYEMTHDKQKFNIAAAWAAAEKVGKVKNAKELTPYLNSKDANVRFWALTALKGKNLDVSSQKEQLLKVLKDESEPNKYLAAELLINKIGVNEEPLKMIKEELIAQDFEPMLLQLAITVRNLDKDAKPLIPLIREKIYPKIAGSIAGKYKSWSYPMFIGMALDQTYINCGPDGR